MTIACIVRDYYSGTECLSKASGDFQERKSDWFLANVIELKKKVDKGKEKRNYEFNQTEMQMNSQDSVYSRILYYFKSQG